MVDRMADDLRRGLPVMIKHGDKAIVIAAAEFTGVGLLDTLKAVGDKPTLLMTSERATSLKVACKGWPQIRIVLSEWMKPIEIQAAADPTLDLAVPFKGPFTRIDVEPTVLESAAIKLLKLARLLPTAIIADILGPISSGGVDGDIFCVSAEKILAAEKARSLRLAVVAEARVPLEGAVGDCKLISFRADTGGTEHMAIIVGDVSPRKPVLTRLHSECFTGDLLGSLKCDCGQQLKGAISAIAEAGGGVILYMAQEGRGIGLISKLKAYALQDQGYDTVDANTKLGFEVDERLFMPAAVMLKKLGFSRVRLMTNNMDKVEALSRFGIDVVERVAHKFPANEHNHAYLETKKTRTGHDL